MCIWKPLLTGNKNPSKLQKRSQRVIRAWQSGPPNLVFFIQWAFLPMLYKRIEPMICEISFSQVHRLCGLAAGSVITTICKFLTFIKFSCLHFGQNKGKFFRIVSLRILSRVLLPQTGHLIHSAAFVSIHYLLQISVRNCLFFCFWHIQRVCQQQEQQWAESKYLFLYYSRT